MNLRLIRHAAPLLLTALLLTACLPAARPPGPVSLYTLQPARQERLAADFAHFAEMILILPVRLAPPLWLARARRFSHSSSTLSPQSKPSSRCAPVSGAGACSCCRLLMVLQWVCQMRRTGRVCARAP